MTCTGAFAGCVGGQWLGRQMCCVRLLSLYRREGLSRASTRECPGGGKLTRV